jgi:pimeloyl-ACP methyl ester carboxylesterase
MGNNAVIYLLPGLLCDETVWRHQIAALSPLAEIRVPDFRGLSSFREMALKVLRGAPGRFSVAGHSMGARVALELMQLAPERIDKFVLMDLGVHPVQPGEAEERMVLVHVAEEQGMEVLADAWIPPMIARARHGDAGLIQEIRTMVLRSTPADYRGQIEAALQRTDQSQYLPAIKHKVLLICGAEDEWSPVAQHESIRHQLSSAELIVIPHSGHMVTMEQPEAVNKVLLEWFQGEMVLPGN